MTYTGVNLSESITYCNGLDPTIKANQYCVLPMSALIASPYELPLGAIVQATVEALNVVGYSTPSVLNIVGANIRT